jgi:hypothetical protein
MPDFKRQLKRDLETVFHNPDEHADTVDVIYSGKLYTIPVVIDSEGARDRKQPSGDNAGGIFVSDMTVYISYYDMETVPRKGRHISIADTKYEIVKSDVVGGQITLDLEVYDE